MKTITINYESLTNDYAEGSTTTFKKTADITFDNNTELTAVSRFIENAKKIWKLCTKEYEHEHEYRSLEIMVSVAEWNDGQYKSISFDRWYTRSNDDINTDPDEKMVYLVPDTRYTAENRDMAIGKDVIKDIAWTIN